MLRLTISHNKNPQEVIKIIDKSLDDVFKAAGQGLVQITDQNRVWNGQIMTFSLTVKAGFLSAPVKGTVEVTAKDVTIDADLGLFGKFITEDKARAAIEGRVKGLLA